MSLPLAGRGIVVTRPTAQAQILAQGIREAGGEALVFSAIEIEPVADDVLVTCIDHLDTFDAAIFISPNAARHGLAAVQTQREWPASLKIFAIGPGTARELAQHGMNKVIQADGADSEALLDMPQLHQVTHQRWLIFRGVGGRELLADTLTSRGAHVTYAECYRRVRPARDAQPLLQRWRVGQIHAVTIHSTETLHNFAHMLGEAGLPLLRATPVFAPHEKIAQAARACGIQQVTITAGGNAGLLAALITWFQAHA
ncbi:MAG: uroporphyrinogen-III synthase [Thiobacillus sp.]